MLFRSPTAIMQLKYYKTNIIQLIKLIKNRWNGISRKCFALIVRVFTIQWFFCIYTKHKETHCVYTRFASHTHVAFAKILLHKHDQLISKMQSSNKLLSIKMDIGKESCHRKSACPRCFPYTIYRMDHVIIAQVAHIFAI